MQKTIYLLTGLAVFSLMSFGMLAFDRVWAQTGSGVGTSGYEESIGSEIGKQLGAAGGSQGAGYGEPTDPRTTVALIIRSVLNFLGIIFLVLIIYAGFLWMTAGGNEEKVEKAKKLLFRAVIGLVIILAAYSITWFAFKIALNYYDDPTGAGVYYSPMYTTK